MAGLNLGLGLSGAAGGALETAQQGLRERLLIAQQQLADETRRAEEARLRRQQELEMGLAARLAAKERAMGLQGRFSTAPVSPAPVSGIVSAPGLDEDGPRAGTPPGLVRHVMPIPSPSGPPGGARLGAETSGTQLPTPAMVAGVGSVGDAGAGPQRAVSIPALTVGGQTLAEGYDEPIRSREEAESDFIRQALMKEFYSGQTLGPDQVRTIGGQTVGRGSGVAMPSGPEGFFLRMKQAEMGRPMTSAEIASALRDYRENTEDPEVRALRTLSIARAQKALRGSDVKLSPGALEMAATQYRLLGASGIPTRLGEEARTRIMNEADAQNKALGHTPAAMVQQQYALKSDSKALDFVAKMRASNQSFESKAIAQAGKVEALSEQIARTDWVPLNEALMAGQTRVFSDPKTTALQNAIITFVSEYAKIIEGSTGSAAGSSDAARRAAEKLLNAGMSQGTVREVVALMKWEMKQTIKGWDATANIISARMMGVPLTGGEPDESAEPIMVDAFGNPIKG